MAYCVDTGAESGRNPVSKHQIQLECKERAGWRGTPLVRPNFQARTGIGGNILSVQLTTNRVGNHTRLTHTLLEVLIRPCHAGAVEVCDTKFTFVQ